MQQRRAEVEAIWPVAPIQPDHGHLRPTQLRQYPLQRRYRAPRRGDVDVDMVKPAPRRTEIVLHVDDDAGSVPQIEANALRLRGNFGDHRHRRAANEIDLPVGDAPRVAWARSERDHSHPSPPDGVGIYDGRARTVP
jgi:hypothetical protein